MTLLTTSSNNLNTRAFALDIGQKKLLVIMSLLVATSLFSASAVANKHASPLVPLSCAAQSERDQMNINEIGTNGVAGPIRFVELKVLEDQVDILGYEICKSDKGDIPQCVALGDGNGTWNNSGFLDNNGPDSNAPTTFNQNTWIAYDMGNIDSNEAEVVIKNSATQEVLDYICFSKLDNCGTTEMYWDVPIECGNLLVSDPNAKTFSRTPDGDGGWSNLTDPPTTGGSNEGPITNEDICTDIATETFVTLYAENRLIFNNDFSIHVTDSDGLDTFSSGSAKTYTGPASIDSDAFYQGGLYSLPAPSPTSFPIFSGTLDTNTSVISTWAAGDWNQVTAYPGTDTEGGTYRTNQLIISDLLGVSPSIDLTSGNYFIDDLDVLADAGIAITDPNTNIFINTSADIADGSQLIPTSADPGDFTLILYPGANLIIGDNVSFTGNIVAMGSTSSITVGNNFNLTGSIISEGDITVNGNIAINYTAQVIKSQEVLFGCGPVATAAYFKVTTASNGLTCSPQPVNISAYRLDDTLATDYIGTVTIDNRSLSLTNAGDWLDSTGLLLAGNGTVDDGSSTLDFTLTDTGSIDLLLSNTQAGDFNIDVLDSVLSITESTSFDPNTTFADAGFQWQDPTGIEIPSVTVPFLVAGSPTDIQVRAVTTDPTTGVCTDLFATGTDVTLDIGSQCLDPLTCAIGQRISASNNGNNFELANPQNLILGQSTTNQTVRFNTNSTAAITLDSPDVGQMELFASHLLQDAAGNPTGNEITGSAVMTIKPDHLTITDITDSSGNASPGSTTAVGGTPVFAKAGEIFQLKVEGRSSTGAITPSFGRETTTPQPDINGSVYYPATGNTGTLTRSGNWVPAAASGTLEFDLITNGLTYSEVGALTAQARLTDYLTSGSVTGIDSAIIGRFKPDRFDIIVNTPVIDSNISACGFAYRGQTQGFDTAPVYQITALNTLGVITQNYDNEFFTLPGTLNVSGLDITDSGLPWTPPMLWTGQWLQIPGYDGRVNMQIDSFNLTKNEIPSATEGVISNPTVRISLLDSVTTDSSMIHDADGTCYEPAGTCQDYTSDLVFSGIQWLYGRATLTNVYGAEIRDLDIPVTIQRWDGSFWQTQVLETGCTSFLTADFALGSWSIETGIPTTSITNWTGLSLGEGAITLAAPGDGNTGTIPVTLTVPSWLQYHWDDNYLTDPLCTTNTDVCLDNPTASAKFGIYEGRRPILFRFQVFR